jgi:hypothetical protein
MKPSLKNTRYVLSSQSLLTMSVVLIVVWIYIFLAPAPVNVSEVSLPWFATATPAASVTPTKTATPTVIPSPTATLVPTATPTPIPSPTPTPTPKDLYEAKGWLIKASFAGDVVCLNVAWENMGFDVPNGSTVKQWQIKKTFNAKKVYCYYYMVLPSQEGGIGWLIYAESIRSSASENYAESIRSSASEFEVSGVSVLYTAAYAKALSEISGGWNTPTPMPTKKP